jgi:UPF0042 nucleotide-binding protein
MPEPPLIIITGLSGSGKSTSLDALEDAGYFCVDNMPVALLPKFLELPLQKGTSPGGFAFGMDLREPGFLANYREVFEGLRKQGSVFTILFLEANTEVIVQRYSQTRRQHPLGSQKNIFDNIEDERAELQVLRGWADRVIDTSKFTVHDLKTLIRNIINGDSTKLPIRIQIVSFGFKNGIPLNADLMVDVRFINNPYFDPDLKNKNGLHGEVECFVMNCPEAKTFLSHYLTMLDFLIPLYQREGKAYLTIAVGCTGGHHRSVVIATQLEKHIKRQQSDVHLLHRDICTPLQ